MDKYSNETPELKKRTEKYAKLYEKNDLNDYSEFNVNSNVSVLKNNVRNIHHYACYDFISNKCEKHIHSADVSSIG